ncbi:hypothetical protein F2Q69_00019677 [Brassica cretica]|uniref:Uncharacterized protein n=1 Tax=Brassica cretica TaxID=69181 RepID=A0A8S9QPF2_BRACR|nr:hypothetical protein F2Q69_00019677 [Brassica cretica]
METASSVAATRGGKSGAPFWILEDAVIKCFGVIGVRWVLTYLVKSFRGGGRLKPRLRGSLAKMVSLKRSVKIAAVEDSVLRCFCLVKLTLELVYCELLERIRTVSRQIGELHQQEFELHAQMMAIEIQRAFELSLGEQNKELATLRCSLSVREVVQEACVMKMELNGSLGFVMRDVPYEKARSQRIKRERFPWCVLLLGVERHSEALSDGVRCGLSLVALELALCVVELAIVYSSCELLCVLSCRRQCAPVSRMGSMHACFIPDLCRLLLRKEWLLDSLQEKNVVESGNGSNTSENNFQDISSQFRDALRLDSNALTQKPEEANGLVNKMVLKL